MGVAGADSSSDQIGGGGSGGDGGEAPKKKHPKLCCGLVEPNANLTPEEKQKKYKYHIPLAVVSGIASFVLLIMSIIALTKLRNYSEAYKDIVDTWNAVPIVDLEVASSCSSGYKDLIQDGGAWQWGGTYDACLCTGSMAGNTTDTTGCTSELISKGCDDRDGLPKVDVPLINGKKICVKRGGVAALDRPYPNKNGVCPSGYMTCGAEADVFCALGSVCPVTDLLITSTSLSVGPNITKTPISGTSFYLYVAHGDSIPVNASDRYPSSFKPLPVTQLPITDLKVFNGEPCTITSSCYYGGRSSEYASMENKEKSFGSRGWKLRQGACDGCTKPPDSDSVSPNGDDIRYKHVFGIEERTAFMNAGSIPNYYITTQTNYMLYLQARSEIEWEPTCEVSREDIDRQRTDVDRVTAFQIVLLVLAILTFIIFSLAMPYVEYKTKGSYLDDPRAWYCTTGLNYGFKLMVVAFTLATMGISIGVLTYWRKVNGSSDSTECADPLSTEVFMILTDEYESLSYSNVGSSVAMGFTGVLDALSSFIWACAK